jgi:transcriptional regulator of acetoin/glycerol metabolism
VIEADAITIRAESHLPATAPADVVPLADAERRAIVAALEAARWRISGEGGAAALLALKPTTLHAKMKKLGIHRTIGHEPLAR